MLLKLAQNTILTVLFITYTYKNYSLGQNNANSKASFIGKLFKSTFILVKTVLIKYFKKYKLRKLTISFCRKGNHPIKMCGNRLWGF